MYSSSFSERIYFLSDGEFEAHKCYLLPKATQKIKEGVRLWLGLCLCDPCSSPGHHATPNLCGSCSSPGHHATTNKIMCTGKNAHQAPKTKTITGNKTTCILKGFTWELYIRRDILMGTEFEGSKCKHFDVYLMHKRFKLYRGSWSPARSLELFQKHYSLCFLERKTGNGLLKKSVQVELDFQKTSLPNELLKGFMEIVLLDTFAFCLVRFGFFKTVKCYHTRLV